MKNKISISILLFLLSVSVKAHTLLIASNEPEMADLFYSEGKIWVVIAVFSCAAIGIGVYLFSMDKKISRIESLLKKQKD